MAGVTDTNCENHRNAIYNDIGKKAGAKYRAAKGKAEAAKADASEKLPRTGPKIVDVDGQKMLRIGNGIFDKAGVQTAIDKIETDIAQQQIKIIQQRKTQAVLAELKNQVDA